MIDGGKMCLLVRICRECLVWMCDIHCCFHQFGLFETMWEEMGKWTDGVGGAEYIRIVAK